MDQTPLFRTEEKEIDGEKISVTVFPGLHGLKIKGRLLKIISPSIGKAFGGVIINKGKSLAETDFNIGVIGEAIQAFTEQLDNEKVIQLIKDLLSSTRINDQEANRIFDKFFSGNYLILYKIIMFVIETNRFFGERSIGEMIKNIGETTAANIPTKSKKD